MRKPYKKISYEERKKIERYINRYSVREIAFMIGVTESALYRELKRGGEPYSADAAQRNLAR